MSSKSPYSPSGPFGRVSLSLMAQADWPLYQMPCHVRTRCTQRGGWTASARILKTFIKFSIKMKLKSQDFSQILVYQIQKAVLQDKDYKELLKQLARCESVSDYTLKPQAKFLLFKDPVVIPRNHELQLDILQKCHDSPWPGEDPQAHQEGFFWSGMNQIIKDYVSSCQQCSRNKNIHYKKFGLLKPLQIPSGPWNSLSMDFIT
ncbi:hypothetical protein O181_126957 [Austropuccinia psidii MF-1]|uniref:Integrase zinc-binding domain-containing protein n=1 Tax=Austropuccinia psidii MF-1 TaxID=1389203 RepID=A0A9Q3Q902_9BASI|nr:hypothetical protein [Austropuccinia psidii MF-1]